jgi:hypothetical protein
MTSLNARDRDDFLKALEEARRAAMAETEELHVEPRRDPPRPPVSAEFRRVMDLMAGKLRSYVSAKLLAMLYAESGPRQAPPSAAAPAPAPPKSEHDAVVDELRLSPNLTAADLVRLRREFAKLNHPDRVLPPGREQATRRMTIANCVIDEALRSRKPRPQ